MKRDKKMKNSKHYSQLHQIIFSMTIQMCFLTLLFLQKKQRYWQELDQKAVPQIVDFV